jgi:outer membrane autotransporter protein
LRVLLNGGTGHGGVPGGKLEGPPGSDLTPGLWIKGAGTWLDQDDKASTSADGRTYNYNLDRDLDIGNVEGGVDFGARGLWTEGDALIFGILGSGVFATLDYEEIVRTFDIGGGEVGGYVTYLNGGLFVDTLVKVAFLEFDPNEGSGLPGSLDSTTWGFRTDAGYRFGAARQGAFVEPQASIAVARSEIDNFTLGGNAVEFSDETDVRGRLGVRVGTSHTAKDGMLVEPFVTGSVWGDFSGDNKATLTSLGTTFGPFKDHGDDVWGVVSGGVNVFSQSGRTSIFAKLDVVVGEDTDGLSAKGGLRYNW